MTSCTETHDIVVQINGKFMATVVSIPLDTCIADIEKAALACPPVVEALAGRTPTKVVVVPKHLVNILL